ncbi:phage baseplate protein [Massilia atriviolacea]|uniref:Phage baseplate protein n=1 Tax=Massilia atriviolacea TaxID=2495579 RepID=A0A430HF37_9BURK|nr:GPW/gp25 family protein [Massilia atriviolacea]RSZ56148.1 phage baseplate protein [Massilia atriviolacea]
MDGINANTGKRLGGLAHLRQSIRDILTTPTGTRVMRRDYGSRLPRLVDAPINSDTILEMYAATAEALRINEPRFRLHKALIVNAVPGRIEIDLTGDYLPEGRLIKLDGIEIT